MPDAPATPEQKAAIRAGCETFLSFDKPRTAAAWIERLAASPHLALGLDSYSAGPAIALLEQRVATLLGKEAACWFPKGIAAQQAALLAHADARGVRTVALHPKSHIALDEAGALERLAGLVPLRLGTDRRHFGVAELQKVSERLAAVVLELPLRRAGYQGLGWGELTAIADWARAAGVPLHLDGARLWEVQPWIGRSFAEIAGLADTLYVSLYKGLGGLAGCVLAGDAATIAAAKIWRLRFGGDLPVAFPLIVAALDGLDEVLPRMDAYYRHACALAARIAAVPGLRVFPEPPHCNSFQVHFPVGAETMQRAALEIAETQKFWTFGWFEQGLLPGHCMGEVVVGEAAMALSADEVGAVLAALLERATTFS